VRVATQPSSRQTRSPGASRRTSEGEESAQESRRLGCSSTRLLPVPLLPPLPPPMLLPWTWCQSAHARLQKASRWPRHYKGVAPCFRATASTVNQQVCNAPVPACLPRHLKSPAGIPAACNPHMPAFCTTAATYAACAWTGWYAVLRSCSQLGKVAGRSTSLRCSSRQVLL